MMARRSLFLVALVASAIVLTWAVERWAHARSRVACWGDIVPAAYAPSLEDIVKMQHIYAERRAAGEEERIASFDGVEIHYSPILYRSVELGWHRAYLACPSSCSEREIPLDTSRVGTSPTIALVHDEAHDVEVILASESPLLAFRLHAAPGFKYKPSPAHITGEALGALATILLCVGLALGVRGHPKGAHALVAGFAASLAAVLFFFL